MATGFGDSLVQAVQTLGVVAGEIDNIVEAALHDIGDNVLTTLRVDWPQGDRSKPWMVGVHSADLWELQSPRKLAVAIHNSAPYAQHVHHEEKYGGPPHGGGKIEEDHGLASRVVPDLVQQVQDAPLDFMSERVLALLAGV